MRSKIRDKNFQFDEFSYSQKHRGKMTSGIRIIVFSFNFLANIFLFHHHLLLICKSLPAHFLTNCVLISFLFVELFYNDCKVPMGTFRYFCLEIFSGR